MPNGNPEPVPAPQPLRKPPRCNHRPASPEVDLGVVDVYRIAKELNQPVAVLHAVAKAHIDGAVGDVSRRRHAPAVAPINNADDPVTVAKCVADPVVVVPEHSP